MAPGDKNKLDGYPATPDDLALDLQDVTNNTTRRRTTNVIETSGGVKPLPVVPLALLMLAFILAQLTNLILQ